MHDSLCRDRFNSGTYCNVYQIHVRVLSFALSFSISAALKCAGCSCYQTELPWAPSRLSDKNRYTGKWLKQRLDCAQREAFQQGPDSLPRTNNTASAQESFEARAQRAGTKQRSHFYGWEIFWASRGRTWISCERLPAKVLACGASASHLLRCLTRKHICHSRSVR